MFYAIFGCTHALLMLGPCIYRAVFVQYYVYARIKNVPIIYLSFVSLISCILSIGLALGVIFAVSHRRTFSCSIIMLMNLPLGWILIRCSIT